MRVCTKSNSGKVAGAIAGLIRSGTPAVLEAIGAGAVYQAVSAIVIAQTYIEDAEEYMNGKRLNVAIKTEHRDVEGKNRRVFIITVTGDQ